MTDQKGRIVELTPPRCHMTVHDDEVDRFRQCRRNARFLVETPDTARYLCLPHAKREARRNDMPWVVV